MRLSLDLPCLIITRLQEVKAGKKPNIFNLQGVGVCAWVYMFLPTCLCDINEDQSITFVHKKPLILGSFSTVQHRILPSSFITTAQLEYCLSPRK